jgi:hypothetical protein
MCAWIILTFYGTVSWQGEKRIDADARDSDYHFVESSLERSFKLNVHFSYFHVAQPYYLV